VAHLAPFAANIADTTVDIRTDAGAVVVDDVAYKGYTDPYLELPAGEYDLKITTPDGTTDLFDIDPFTLTDGEVKSVFAIGDITNQPLNVVAISQVAATTADVWVAHLAPFASDTAAATVSDTAVTVRVNGAAALTDFRFGETSGGYVALPALPTLVEIVLPGDVVAISGTFTLSAGMDYTVAAIGDGTNQPLELLALADDNSAPASGKGKVRIVHLASFSSDLEATKVDVRTEADALVIGDVPYKGNSGYLSLDSGLYDLKITAPGGGPAVIDMPPFVLPKSAILTVFAIGDGTNQPLDTLTLTYELGVGTVLYMPLLAR
jgi:hypothetical protein